MPPTRIWLRPFNGNEVGSNQVNYLEGLPVPVINVWTRKDPLNNSPVWKLMPVFQGKRVSYAEPYKAVYSYLFPITMDNRSLVEPSPIIIKSINEFPAMKIKAYTLSHSLPPII